MSYRTPRLDVSDEARCNELVELLQRTKHGAIFYVIAFTGIVFVEPAYWQPLISKVAFSIMLIALLLRFPLSSYFQSHSQDIQAEMVSRKLLRVLIVTSALGWSAFSTTVLISTDQLAGLVALAYLSTLAIACGTLVAMTTDVLLLRIVLLVLLVPMIVAAFGFAGAVGTLAGIYTLVFLFYLLSKGDSLSQSYWTYIRQNDRLRHQAMALENAWHEAQEASEVKGRFLSHMSHEIRTPMNGVLGTVELLGQADLQPEQREQVQTIKSSGRLLLRILDDVLDYSRLESNAMQVEVEPVAIRDVVDSCKRLLQPLVHHGVAFSVNIDDAVPDMVEADPVRIEQLLFNLANNALKFTASGSVTINVTSQPIDNRTARIKFEVTDTGVGISEADQKRIFEQFSKVEFNRGNRSGAGLGLAISKRLIEIMDGVVGVESTLGKGSTFWFELPLTVVARPQVDVEQTPRPIITGAGMFAGKRILLAEDNLVNQSVAKAFLGKMGCEVEVAGDGEQALAQYQKNRPDLVLMDCNMPAMDGFHATRAIRQYERDEGLLPRPIIALTAHAFSEIAERCLAAGMDEHLAKPIAYAKLQESLSRFLGGSPD